MKEILFSKAKVKNFLAERLTQQVLQLDEHKIYSLIRYEGIGGYNKVSDGDLFVQMVEAIPEFKLLKILGSDENNLVAALKNEYQEKEEEILIDIQRIIQMKLS
jgi:hypothetical protein